MQVTPKVSNFERVYFYVSLIGLIKMIQQTIYNESGLIGVGSTKRLKWSNGLHQRVWCQIFTGQGTRTSEALKP